MKRGLLMYKINFDKYCKFLNWNILFWGIKNDIIGADSAIHYADKLVENNLIENDSLLVELFILDNIDKDNVLGLLSNIVSQDVTEEYTAKKILRYIILDSIRQTIKDNETILSTIENVYADFDYPEDMESFISYMPVDDPTYTPSEHTLKENEQRLIEKFNKFLKNELQFVNKALEKH